MYLKSRKKDFLVDMHFFGPVIAPTVLVSTRALPAYSTVYKLGVDLVTRSQTVSVSSVKCIHDQQIRGESYLKAEIPIREEKTVSERCVKIVKADVLDEEKLVDLDKSL